ncbi:ABC transporter substrate-binding protein [Pseudokineococcus sp. 1T1Z-3]|uniref:ABC transporter substrate-binding protein n=1 Tax=Pseudokineococcus sp. 1T1Z-3 TaxID=3132745 RepID=UPI0030AB3D34
MRRNVAGRAAAVLTAGALVAVAGCASERDDTGGGTGEGGDGGTFVFAASSDPVVLDPAFASDGETFRVARQIFEGLVGTEPGTADPAPLLAESWESTDDGLSYTFDLREGVTFHDGTVFDAAAVCFNFDRWYGWTGLTQNENISYYYNNLYQGFAESEDPERVGGLYESCTVDDEQTATVTLTRPFAGFIASLSLPAFSMQSPTALEEYDADNLEGDADDVRFSAYGTEHPTGTGPFVFDSWQRGQSVTLSPYPDYWGDVAQLDSVVIQTISDGNARRQALEGGTIDGYDLVAPGDIDALEAAGFQIEDRDPFNLLYLGINQAVPELADPLVREAIAHAIDKDAVISQSMPEGSTVATQFMPEIVTGWSPDVETYEYDPDRARELLAEAGQSDLTIDFVYPTGVSRPYMPNPEDSFVAMRSQLEAVGITVNPVALPWSPDYLDRVIGSADHGLHLLGWTGDYNDPDNFVGVFFGTQSDEWGFDNPELFAALAAARELPSEEEQGTAYEAINQQVMEFLPGIPIASPVPSLAFAERVSGYEPSPVQDEVWNGVTVS